MRILKELGFKWETAQTITNSDIREKRTSLPTNDKKYIDES